MTRLFLIASVAALAITAPAHAQRGGDKDERAAARAEAEAKRGEAKNAKERGQARVQREEQRVKAERPQREQRVQRERPQPEQRVQKKQPQREQRVQRERPQREQQVQRERPQREQQVQVERQKREQRVQAERPQREQRARTERTQREQRVRAERAQREQRVRTERAQREQRIERTQRAERLAKSNDRGQQRVRQQDRQAERVARVQTRDDRRFDRVQVRDERRSDQIEARTNARIQLAEVREQRRVRPQRSVGERVNLRDRRDSRDWYNGFAEQRHRTFYNASPNYLYDYNYDDGYLYQLNRDDYRVVGLFPLLGGAFGVGQPVPIGYDNYNVPYGYQSRYFDTPDYYYRYGDGAIYQVDRDSQLIQAVVALLSGQNFGVGQRMPLGYDVYNVPYAYRDRYADTSNMWYRYDDGYIYGVDPYSRMIRNVSPVSYGYTVGYPAPAYASYGGYGSPYGYGGYGGYGDDDFYDAGYGGYGVPYDYRDLYYAEPGYNYQYANGGIYQVDPSTQLVQALVALVTGTSLGVGQALPMGYDVYNVPYAYRSSYADTPDAWYRYDDGYIYGVDPRTRIIQTAVPVAYDGYTVGYPMPAYAGYAVPDSYDGLYYAEPGYDYRYLNGGIYRVDPDTRMVQGVAALLTGQNLGVGQVMPVGYDVYNVPYAYRSDYADTSDAWYRYNDGHIYRVDPQTRVIQAVIDAIA